ncbi:phosphoribosylanthranilate isomerase [Clostridium sp. BJN0001]|uniref:phosphoribosylanthranilate isomerase n=1 Tax=Clostridium sp. BJN0001 TaxID=2930219 RepID=UPI001FD21548|nr:phosphoribosylanthranilate isomerase [Clostridium sp. BJN0001]
MIEIKICGIKALEEIESLNILKPDYAGFIFTESKRKIDLNDAEKLILKLDKKIKRVGVFRNNSLEDIISVLNKVDLDVVQLHGDEDLNFIDTLKRKIDKNILIFKAFSVEESYNIKTFINDSLFINIDKIIIDGQVPGSGKAYNINKLSNLVNDIREKTSFFLSGGLNPENVVSRIKKVYPSGVDISSGVEGENYIKSYEKMKKLIDNVRALN